MNIVIEALGARFGGTAFAAIQIARALEVRADVSRVVVITRANSIVSRGLLTSGKVKLIELPQTETAELLRRLLWQARRLSGALRENEADGLLSMSGMLPTRPRVPYIALQANPTPYEDAPGLAQSLRRAALRRTSLRAVAVFVPSSHVASLVSDLPRVEVVPLGVDSSIFHPGIAVARDELLCVGDFYAHKHHGLILDAYDRLDPSSRPSLRLIGDPAVDRTVFDHVRERAAAIPGVIVAGRVGLTALLAAYARAQAMVIASDRESFAMPVAEALACGVPVVARDYPTLRETAGDGGQYVAGDDPADWAEALRLVTEDRARRDELTAAGIRHAARFSWDDFAARLLARLSEPR